MRTSARGIAVLHRQSRLFNKIDTGKEQVVVLVEHSRSDIGCKLRSAGPAQVGVQGDTSCRALGWRLA